MSRDVLPGWRAPRIVRPMSSSARFLSSARTISLFTLASRVLGVVREAVFSHFFAAGELLSAFTMAFMLPNLARRLFGEGALSSAMIPVLTQSIEHDGEEQARRFTGSLLTVLVVVLAAGVLLAEGGIAVWRYFRDDTALGLAGLLMPYMLLICTVAVSGGVLNVRRHFAVPAATPIIFNAVVIVVALVAALGFGWRDLSLLHAVCAAVMIAGTLQLVVTGAALKRIGFFPIFGGSWRDPRIKKVMLMMAPMVVGLSAVQINTLADYVIAYLFVSTDHGRVGPAVLRYAHYLYQLPLGVFGIAIATAIYPVFSRHAARNDHAGLADDLVRGTRLCVFIALPATVGLCAVAKPLVASIFEHGEFDAWATDRVARTLVFYCLGLSAYFVQHLFVRAFYATHDSKTPARIAIRMVAMNLMMNLVLVFVMAERGLALATATCAVIQALWLARSLSRSSLSPAWSRLGAGFLKSAICTAIMSAGLWGAHSLIPVIFGDEPASVVRLMVMVLVGIAVYVAAARALRVEELGMLLRRTGSDQAVGDDSV